MRSTDDESKQEQANQPRAVEEDQYASSHGILNLLPGAAGIDGQ
jgi:hypothetical protein